MSVFVFASAEYKDKAEYEKYVAASTPIFLREGVKVLGNDEAGSFIGMPGDKAVLLEFRDMDHLKHFFSLPDYQAAAVHRDAGAVMRTATFRKFPAPT